MRTNLHLVLVASTFLATGCAGTAPEEGAQGSEASLGTAAASPSGGGGGDGGCGDAPKVSPTRYNSVGAGTDASPFQIWNVDQLKDLARDAQGATGNYAFRQCVDINMAGVGPFTIPEFTGRYDGDSHSLSKLNAGMSTNGMGFIGKAENAAIKNLTFAGPVATAPDGYKFQVGIVAAYIHSTQGIQVLTNVRVTNARVTGKNAFAGAVAGWLGAGIVSGVEVVDGTVTALKAGGAFGYAYGSGIRNTRIVNVVVAGGDWAGGVAGKTFESAVERTWVATSFLQGTYVGGLAAFAEDSTFRDDKVTSAGLYGMDSTGGVAGLAEGKNSQTSFEKVTVLASALRGARVGGVVGETRTADGRGAFEIDKARVEGTSLDGEFRAGGLVGVALASRLQVLLSVATDLALTSRGIGGGLLGESNVDWATVENSFAGGRLSAPRAGGIVGSGDIGGAFLVTRVSIDASTVGGGMTGSNTGGVPSSGIAFAGAASGGGALGPIAPQAFPWAGDLYYEDSFPCSGNCNNAGISAPLSQLRDPSQVPLNTFPFGSGIWAIGPDGYPTIPSAGATW